MASLEDLKGASDAITEYLRHVHTHKREYISEKDWYPWQIDYFQAGAQHDSVMLMAGNQTGKTYPGTYEFALHATGDYPDWWMGDTLPVGGIIWVFGVDASQLRDVIQANLFGTYNTETRKFEGGGWIHPKEIVNHVPHPNKKGLAADVFVRHRKGGVAAVALRTYTQTETGKGTLSFAGSKVDAILVDEQPPDDLVGQLAVRRTMGRFGKGGLIRYTMTPELGKTELIRKFMDEPGPNQKLIGPIAWSDCPHITPERAEALLQDIPVHEHDMRSKGMPFFGSGMVYPVGEKAITCNPFEIPPYYKRIAGLDIGGINTGHATACAFFAYNEDTDTIYLYDEYKNETETAGSHAIAIKSRGEMPLVVPPDIEGKEKGSGETVAAYYKGITHKIPFKNPDGTNFVAPGIMDILERMKTGRFKVFSTCTEWLKEFRAYHRDKGKIVKKNDDLMDATRYGAVMVATHGVTMSSVKRPTRVISTLGSRR